MRDKIVEAKPRRSKLREQTSKERSKSDSSIRDSLVDPETKSNENPTTMNLKINLSSSQLVTSSSAVGGSKPNDYYCSLLSKSDLRKPIMSSVSGAKVVNTSYSLDKILARHDKVSAGVGAGGPGVSELDYFGCKLVNSNIDKVLTTSTTSGPAARHRVTNDRQTLSYKMYDDLPTYNTDLLKEITDVKRSSRKDVNDLKSIIKLDQIKNESISKNSVVSPFHI